MKLLDLLFKRDKTKKIINIPEEIYKNKKIYSHEDFYKELGLLTYFEEMRKQSKFDRFHIYNVRANYDTCMRIYNFIQDNLLHTKNKYSKMYKEKPLKMIAAQDFLIWSPKTTDTLKDNIIQVILPGDKEYTEVQKDEI